MIGGIWGAIKGFIDEVAQKFGYVAGFIIATMFTIALSKFVSYKLNLPQWFAAFLSYVFLFIVGFLLMKLLGNILEQIFDTAKLTSVNNVLGFVLGILEALIIIGVIETALSYQNLINVSKFFDESFMSSSIILPVFKKLLSLVQSLI